MAELTNGEVEAALRAVAALSKMEMTVTAALKVRKLAKTLTSLNEPVADVRKDLIERYGSTNSSGEKEVKPESPNWKSFIDDFEKLMKEKVEVEDGSGIRVVDLVTTDKDEKGKRVEVPLTLAPEILIGLGDLLIVEE